jgi:hypothetical protein
VALTRDTLAERKLKILLRAQFKVKQQFEYEEWKEAELYPMLEKMKAGGVVLGLEPGALFDLKVVHETPDHPEEPEAE